MSMETELLTNQGRWAKRRRNAMKDYIVELAGGCCQICSYDKCNSVLNFHHIDPKTKSFALTGGKMTYSLEAIVEELAKCVMLCSNCHIEVHAGLHKEKVFKPIIINKKLLERDVLSRKFGFKIVLEKQMVEMSCPSCETIMIREKRQTHLSRKDKSCAFCSPECIAKFNSKNRNNPAAYIAAGKSQIIRIFGKDSGKTY